jgi:ABC-type multidrug transport system fused ATPase/permease subunit
MRIRPKSAGVKPVKATADRDRLSNLLACLWHNLTRRRQRQFVLLTGLMLVSSFVEVVSLGAVLPFIGILVAPDRTSNHPVFADMLQLWGFTSANQLVLPLTVAFATAALIAGAIRIFLLWASTRLAFATGSDLSIEVYRRTLYQPYRVHIAQNSSEVISGITNKVNGVVAGVLLPSLILVSSLVLLLAIMIALIAINPMVASLAAVSFGVSYALIARMTHRRLRNNSQRIAYEQTHVIKALQEGLGGIRDVLLDGAQPVYCEIYRQADQPLRKAQGNNIFYGGSPRYVMEALGMVLIASLAYTLSTQAGGIATALPVLGALAVGAQRLLPALQQGYSSWASIAGNHASLADIVELLQQPLPTELLQPAPAPLHLQSTIRLDSVRFRYSSDAPWVLDGLNLTIHKGARVGFIGSTGSGKSTTLDLLMGLLIPTEGELFVDAVPINGNSARAWRQTIAHVPQNIYLADATLAENIAFGVPRSAIDLDRVRKAARQAQIADFIESSPQEYQAYVGERGIRLSGGQRQRIGIARALYKQAEVIVFDEATSALDTETERAVIEAIECLGEELTVLIVAHRLTTLKNCTQVIELADGKIKRSGTYQEIMTAAG